MKCVVDNKVSNFQVFGDSQLVIDWMVGKKEVHSSTLRPIQEYLKSIESIFECTYFKHVYRKLNLRAPKLSKEVLLVFARTVITSKELQGIEISSIVRPMFGQD
jgi:hypothetical protein